MPSANAHTSCPRTAIKPSLKRCFPHVCTPLYPGDPPPRRILALCAAHVNHAKWVDANDAAFFCCDVGTNQFDAPSVSLLSSITRLQHSGIPLPELCTSAFHTSLQALCNSARALPPSGAPERTWASIDTCVQTVQAPVGLMMDPSLHSRLASSPL